MFRNFITMFIPAGIADLSGAAAGLAAFDEAARPSPLSVPMDTPEAPYVSSAEAGLMVG